MADSGGQPTGQAPEARPAPGPGPAEERTLIDSIADLLQTIVDWLRQEAEAAVKQKVVLPLQQLGLTLFMAQAAVGLVLLGVIFISVGSLMLLAQAVGWPFALYIVGGVLALIAVILASIAGKWWQK